MASVPVPFSAVERDLWRQVAILRSKAEILGEIAAGNLPATVATFAELHDYLDANELGGLCEEGSATAALALGEMLGEDSDDAANFANEVQDAVDAWLRAGRPVTLEEGSTSARLAVQQKLDTVRSLAKRIPPHADQLSVPVSLLPLAAGNPLAIPVIAGAAVVADAVRRQHCPHAESDRRMSFEGHSVIVECGACGAVLQA